MLVAHAGEGLKAGSARPTCGARAHDDDAMDAVHFRVARACAGATIGSTLAARKVDGC
jgi:hypothetical protein